MSYIQITTKCNMVCQHCCYSCRPGAGEHMKEGTFAAALDFFQDQGYGTITLGGGEPTLHPEFFKYLQKILNNDLYCWLATNGTNTKAMYRLASIINDSDYDNVECNCSEEDQDNGYCGCYYNVDIISNPEQRLSVALSQDWAHNSQKVTPEQSIVDLWTRNSTQRYSHFEIRNVFNSAGGAAAQGRAKRTGAGWGDHCVCSGLMVKPNGDIKPCGCTGAPVIGTVFDGLTAKGEKLLASKKYQNTDCAKGRG